MFERPAGGDQRARSSRSTSGARDRPSASPRSTALADVGRRDRRRQPSAAAARARTRRSSPARGKVEEIAARRARTGADLVIFDHALSGVQQRNLEQALECRVVDRVSLILDIFAQRARSAEGKLQVELAQLKHIATRLVRGWTHLERQKGGIGLRGPGETQLETDRRLIGSASSCCSERLARSRAAARRRVARAGAPRCAPSRSSATRTPASRRCSTA